MKDVNIGLDGVVAQQDNYKKSGFKLAYRNVRHEGRGGGECIDERNIVSLESLSFESIAEYDMKFFPAERKAFLKSWLLQGDSKAVGISENGKITGYAVMRKCREGYKIGSLFADSSYLAEQLFTCLKSSISSSDKIFLDTPLPNEEALKLAKKYNMTSVFETARM